LEEEGLLTGATVAMFIEDDNNLAGLDVMDLGLAADSKTFGFASKGDNDGLTIITWNCYC
jgi:hypothetical protein